MWTILEEDEKVQQCDMEEGRLGATIHEIIQRKKKMSTTENLKGNQDLNNMQVDLKAT